MEGAGFNNDGLVEVTSISSRVRSEKSISSEYDLMPPAPSSSLHIEVSWDQSGGLPPSLWDEDDSSMETVNQ